MPLSRLPSYSALLLVLLATTFNVHADDRRDAQALFSKGVTLVEQNRRPEAIKVFSELTEKYPNLPEPYNNLAVLYVDQGQFDKARLALESALRTHPSYATAHKNLGDIYARMASEAYDKALQLNSGNTRTQSKLALIKDLSSASPIQLASRSIISPPVKEPVKQTPPETPVLPIRPAEPIKLSELKSPELKSPVPKSPESNSSDLKPAEPKPAIAKHQPLTPATSAEADKVVKPKPEPKQEPREPAKPDEDKQIMAAVHNWAEAWSSQKVSRYLDSYADSFQPPDGESRKDWEELRRERITKPASIKVEVSKIQIKMESDKQAKVSFRQSYRAGKTTMRTSKTLIMQKAGGNWLIKQELTDR